MNSASAVSRICFRRGQNKGQSFTKGYQFTMTRREGLTDEALCHEDVWGSGCIDPRILDSALVGGEWSASRIGRFIPKERAPRIHWTGGWMGPGTCMDDVEGTKILFLPGLKLRPFGRPARSHSLYRLCYPGSTFTMKCVQKRHGWEQNAKEDIGPMSAERTKEWIKLCNQDVCNFFFIAATN
jgi:hypothetical protein